MRAAQTQLAEHLKSLGGAAAGVAGEAATGRGLRLAGLGA